MKKVMLMVAFMVAAVAANAQVYIGGSLGVSSDKVPYADGSKEPESTVNFHFTPEIGYNLDENWAVGLGLTFDFTKYPVGADGDQLPGIDRKKFGFEIAPYARWTFARWNKVSLFLEGGLAYGFDKNKWDETDGRNETVTVEDKESYFKIGVKPGLRVDLTDHFAVMTRLGWLGYTCTMPDGDNMNNGQSFGFDLDGENISLGVIYSF